MVRWHKPLMLIAALVPFAGPAFADLAPASAADVVAGVQACADATGPNGVDAGSLGAGGWTKATMTAPAKAPVASELVVYGHAGNSAIVMTGAGADKPKGVCFVVAKIGRVANYPVTVNAISAGLRITPFSKDGNTYRWHTAKNFIQIETTGSQDAPAVRVATMYLPEEKK